MSKNFLEIKNEPPADIKGNGSPFTGMSPTVIAVLTNTCARRIDPMPINARLENLSLDKNALFNI